MIPWAAWSPALATTGGSFQFDIMAPCRGRAMAKSTAAPRNRERNAVLFTQAPPLYQFSAASDARLRFPFGRDFHFPFPDSSRREQSLCGLRLLRGEVKRRQRLRRPPSLSRPALAR